MEWLKDNKTATVGSKRVIAAMNQNRPIYIEGSVRYTYPFGVGVDSTGPSIVSPNQTVGWAEDLSPHKNHAISVTASERPILLDGSDQRFLNFDGVDDYLEIPYTPSLDVSGSRSLTVELWARCTGADWGSVWSVVSKYNQFIIGSFSGSDHTKLAFLISGEGVGWRPINYNSLSWGQDAVNHQLWHHYAGVYDFSKNEISITVDGVVEALYSGDNDPIGFDESPIHIAHRETDEIGINHANAELQDLRIWNHARTLDQINKNKDRRLTGLESGLVGYWPL